MKKLFTFLLFLFFAITSLIKPLQYASANSVTESLPASIANLIVGCDTTSNSSIGVFETQSSGTGYSLEKWFYNCDGASQGAAVTVNSMIASTIGNPPVSSKYYVADLLQNTGFAPQAYAQGVGFSALSPVLPVWKAFRNMTYFLFVIVFVVIGFAIMFRAQLNPQTVVSIQSALPNLVITLLLITFSYAIAGLLIDAMYLAIYLVITMFTGIGFGGTGDSSLQSIAFNAGIFQNMGAFMGGAAWGSAEQIGRGINNMFNLESIFSIFGGIASVLAYMIIAVAILIAMFRTWFALISAYTQIIVAVVTAPFQIMLNALPGSNGFENWLKNLFANIAVFPAVITMIFLVHFLTESANDQTGFAPPQLGGTAGSIPAVMGLGLIMLMPEVVKIVKGALQVKDSELGQIAQANLGAGAAPFRSAGRMAGVAGYELSWNGPGGRQYPGASALRRGTGRQQTVARILDLLMYGQVR